MKETRDGVIKSLLRIFFLSGREVSLDDNFPQTTLSTLFSQDKKHLRIAVFNEKSLSSQELSLAETKVKELVVLR